MTKILGVDEAGRGSVIGPIVLAAVVADSDKGFELRRIGVRDSKAFVGDQRSRYASRRDKLHQMIPILKTWWSFEMVPASRVDEYVSSDEKNLNDLERETALRVMQQLIERIKPDVLVLDGENIFGSLGTEINDIPVIATDKADSKYITVGAASIIAKFLRDKETIDIMGEAFWNGAGYPNDGTKTWIREYLRRTGELPQEIRQSWKWWIKIEEEMRIRDASM